MMRPWEPAFLEALRQEATIREAREAVRVSDATVWRHRQRSARFRLAWRQAVSVGKRCPGDDGAPCGARFWGWAARCPQCRRARKRRISNAGRAHRYAAGRDHNRCTCGVQKTNRSSVCRQCWLAFSNKAFRRVPDASRSPALVEAMTTARVARRASCRHQLRVRRTPTPVPSPRAPRRVIVIKGVAYESAWNGRDSLFDLAERAAEKARQKVLEEEGPA